MRKKIFYVIINLGMMSIIAPGCVSLKQVNGYASESLTGITQFEDIGYNFNQHCLDRCQFEAIRKFEIKREIECNCDIFKTADSVTLLIYDAIKGYFDGLANLSADDLTTYNLDTLATTLTEGNFGDITINKDHVDAYSSVSNILLRAVTDAYRKKKIKQYIEEANQPIQVLIQKFQFILQRNLEGELNFRKEKLFSYYQEMNLNGNLTTEKENAAMLDTTHKQKEIAILLEGLKSMSDYEKGKATIDYYQQLSDVTQKQQQIEVFAESLKSIADGHQKLYDNRNKLTAKEIKRMLIQSSSDIQDLVSEFNTLKK